MKIASWNVNSLKVRLPQVIEWLVHQNIDVLCLQETKLTDDRFPLAALHAAGYEAAFSGQPTYNGVAIVWRTTLGLPRGEVVIGNPLFEDDAKRLISVALGPWRIVSAYIPNGQEVGSDKYAYKLRWLEGLRSWLAQILPESPRLIVAGDYNIAPTDDDVHDPLAWSGKILCSNPERAHFQALQALGLHDAFRLFDQPPQTFSWWDYRQLGFQKNHGLRIDHVLVSSALVSSVKSCQIDRIPRKAPQPSDHAPVIVEMTRPE